MTFPADPSESEAPAAVRPARPQDYAAFVCLFPELGVDDPTAEEDRWVREMMPTTLIAEVGGGPGPAQVVG